MGLKKKIYHLDLSGFQNLTGLHSMFAFRTRNTLTGHIQRILRQLSLLLVLVAATSSCKFGKTRKSDIEVNFMLDTLDVGYTYWWPESGPFIGDCGEELSFVFSGIVTDLEAPTNEAGPLYRPQKGVVTIESVFKIKELGKNTYKNQRFFTTDCFYKSGLGTGDTVLVICYDYENAYTISGSGSILKIDSFEDEAIKSIRKYIDTDENPIKIEKDIGLWATYGHGRALEDLIKCREENENPRISQDIDKIE